MSGPARRIAVVVGSLRERSINRQLAVALAKLAPSAVFEHVDIGDLPLYNQDHDAHMPAPSQRLKRDIAQADAVLFVTPEYNRSIPGVLKNAIDIASRPYGQSAWAGKPAGVIGASGGAIGTALAQQHLRNVLAYLDMPTLNQPEAFVKFPTGLVSDNGDVTDASVAKFLKDWIVAYLAFVEQVLSARA